MLLQSMQSARPGIVENDAWSGAQEMVEGLGSEALEPFAKPPQGEIYENTYAPQLLNHLLEL